MATKAPIAPAAVATPKRGRGRRRGVDPAARRIALRLSEAEYQTLVSAAAERGVPVAEIIRAALARDLPDLVAPTPVTVVRERPARVDAEAAATLRQMAGTLRQALGLGRGEPLRDAQLRRLLADVIRVLGSLRR